MTDRSHPVSGQTRIWRNARLATLAEDAPGLGIVEAGAVAARDGRIVFAGPEADMPPGCATARRSSIAAAAGSRPA